MSALTNPQRLVLIAGFVWFFLMGLAVTMSGPLSVLLAKLFAQPDISQPQMGTALFAGSAGLIFVQALFADKFAGRWLPRFCACSYTTGALLAWQAVSWPMLLLGMLLIGIGNGGASIWYNAEVAKQFEGGRVGAWLTILNGCWAVGAVAGPYLVRQFVTEPRMPLLFLLGLAAISLPLAFSVDEKAGANHSDEANPTKIPRRVFGLGALLGLYVGAEATTLILMTNHLVSFHRMPLADAAGVASALWFAFMIGRFGVSPIAARVHPSRLVLGCAVGALTGILLATMPGMAWIAYPLLGLMMGPVFPAVIAWGTGLSTAAHRVTSIMVMGGCLAAVAFPPITAAVLGPRITLLPWVVGGMFFLIGTLSLALGPFRPKMSESVTP